MPARAAGAARFASVVLFVCTSAAVFVMQQTPSNAGDPSVSITPSGPYHNGQTVSISVGPNNLFTPQHRIIIIECSDPRGVAAGTPHERP